MDRIVFYELVEAYRMTKPVEHGHGAATPSLAIGSLDLFQRKNQEDTTNRTGSAEGGYRYISHWET